MSVWQSYIVKALISEKNMDAKILPLTSSAECLFFKVFLWVPFRGSKPTCLPRSLSAGARNGFTEMKDAQGRLAVQ